MTAALAYLPDDHQAFALARRTLRQPVITDEQLDAAIEVLSASHDWMDCLLVREARKAVELRKVLAVFRAEETPAQIAAPHVPALMAVALGVALAFAAIVIINL